MRTRVRTAWAGTVAVAALAVGGVLLPGPAGAFSDTQSGTHDGYYYEHWWDGQGSVDLQLGPAGNYRYTWNAAGHFLGGKGWKPGGRRTVAYQGSFNTVGNSYLALHGWTTDPLVEYYVIENWGTYRPTGTFQGTITTDGGVYDIYRTERRNYPSINGPASFPVYSSVRQQKHTGGTITTGNHFAAWAQRGMNLGTPYSMVLAVEGYQSSGSADLTVFGGPDPTPTPTTTEPTTTEPTTTEPTTEPPSCSATLSPGPVARDRYDLVVTVTGSDDWTVTMTAPWPARIKSVRNVNPSWTSDQVLVARPTGHGNPHGNTWYASIRPNGNWTWPTVTCEVG